MGTILGPGIAYYLTGELGEKQWFPFNKQDFEHIGLHLLHAQVKHIDPHGHHVSLQNGRPVPYDRLLVATGTRAATAKVPGIDLEGVVKLDNLDDARRILKLARKAHAAVVVGGGNYRAGTG